MTLTTTTKITQSLLDKGTRAMHRGAITPRGLAKDVLESVYDEIYATGFSDGEAMGYDQGYNLGKWEGRLKALMEAAEAVPQDTRTGLRKFFGAPLVWTPQQIKSWLLNRAQTSMGNND